jgi:type I restriction enzyme S subunit
VSRASEHWRIVKLGEVVTLVRGQVDPQTRPDEMFNYLSIGNIESNTGQLVDFTPTQGREIKSVKHEFTPKDVLYSRLRPYLNKVFLPEFNGICATDLLPLRPKDLILRKYLAFYLRSPSVVEYASARMQGIELPRLPASELMKLNIPLLSLEEQKQIVETLEKCFVRTRTAKHGLSRIPELTKRLRTTILSKAFRGGLTSACSELNALETANPFETVEVPLPVGWRWTSVGDLFDIVGGGTPSTSVLEYWQGNIPWITSADIHGLTDIQPRKYITEEAIAHSATRLVPVGSIIVVTRVALGKIVITEQPLCFSQDSQALLRKDDSVFPLYALYYLSLAVREFKFKHRGTTIAGVPKNQLASLPFPLPPLNEQHRVVDRLQSILKNVESLLSAGEETSMRMALLERTALAKAFRGELVGREAQ